jgi:probable HAF family extracellular repeat protein
MFLFAPGAFATTARGINNAGQVVGDFTPGVGTEDHGFVTSPITDADFEREGVPAPLLTSN